MVKKALEYWNKALICNAVEEELYGLLELISTCMS